MAVRDANFFLFFLGDASARHGTELEGGQVLGRGRTALGSI